MSARSEGPVRLSAPSFMARRGAKLKTAARRRLGQRKMSARSQARKVGSAFYAAPGGEAQNLGATAVGAAEDVGTNLLQMQ